MGGAAVVAGGVALALLVKVEVECGQCDEQHLLRVTRVFFFQEADGGGPGGSLAQATLVEKSTLI